MVANIPKVQSAHKEVFRNGILICYGCYKTSELCHIFKGFITYLYTLNLSCSLLTAFTSTQTSLLELNKASAFSCNMYPFNQYINISMNRRLNCPIQFQPLLIFLTLTNGIFQGWPAKRASEANFRVKIDKNHVAIKYLSFIRLPYFCSSNSSRLILFIPFTVIVINYIYQQTHIWLVWKTLQVICIYKIFYMFWSAECTNNLLTFSILYAHLFVYIINSSRLFHQLWVSFFQRIF
jgi:hypothetical protein